MKRKCMKILFALLAIAVSVPYCIKDFSISAYSYILMEFSGS